LNPKTPWETFSELISNVTEQVANLLRQKKFMVQYLSDEQKVEEMTRIQKFILSMTIIILIMMVITLITVLFFIAQTGIPEDTSYVGSKACHSCHDQQYAQWYASLHPKMMQPVSETTIKAELSPDNPNLLFDPQKAVWVIGSKWEQQFMGHDGKTETLLPGAWLVGYKRWKQTGWDGWHAPIPLQRCNGCHVVGLNVETGEFVEAGIGCESCHGPGDWHVKTFGLGRIYSSLDAQMCGQCHTRGRSKDGIYFFPVGYRPGKTLSMFFNEDQPIEGQNSSKWWGNGHAHKRHQEYFAWKQGGHANSLKTLTENYDGRYGEVTSECLPCHAAKAALAGERGVRLENVSQGITCAVCHHVHGKLDQLRRTCADCHGDGAFYHQPERNANHVPCPPAAQVNCVNCHNPLTVKNGGGFTLHSHSPGIIPPKDTAQFGVPSSCANGDCHAGQEVDWLQEAFERHYKVTPK
jgi:hypothetical protein